jgi:hypothetical protein
LLVNLKRLLSEKVDHLDGRLLPHSGVVQGGRWASDGAMWGLGEEEAMWGTAWGLCGGSLMFSFTFFIVSGLLWYIISTRRRYVLHPCSHPYQKHGIIYKVSS